MKAVDQHSSIGEDDEAKEAAAAVAIVRCTCRLTGKTGVEMEAMTGATIAALTVYDMCKAVSHDIRIESTHLVSKSGGRSGTYSRSSS